MNIGQTFKLLLLTALITFLVVAASHSRDPTGQWAQADPGLKQWFNLLASKKGQNCCSVSDGLRIDDADWERQDKPDFPFRVVVEGKWREVPEDAVVEGSNRVGFAIVWPIFIGPSREVTIRCFLPGTEG